MIERERRRIRAAFRAALIAAAAPPLLAVACIGSKSNGADGGTVSTSSAEANRQAFPPADPCAAIISPRDAGGAIIDAGADVEICDLALPCGLPKGFGAVGCSIVVEALDGAIMPDSAFGCVFTGESCKAGHFDPHDGGRTTLLCDCDLFHGGGRRPRGLERPRAIRARSVLAAYLARLAHEESASIAAFELLGDDLAAFGAPPALIEATASASSDEARHARLMTRLARRFGAEPPSPRFAGARGRRSPEAVAVENAVEGCVRETYAALLAHVQAADAGDPCLRRAFAQIASDETRHAALSWAVARWLERQLDRRAKAQVDRRRREAVVELRHDLWHDPPPALSRLAGVPSGCRAHRLLGTMTRELSVC